MYSYLAIVVIKWEAINLHIRRSFYYFILYKKVKQNSILFYVLSVPKNSDKRVVPPS